MGETSGSGKVWLVGAGPGDPGLITWRGAQVLGSCDVVLHDALSHPALLELCPQAEAVDVGKRFGQPSAHQPVITARLIELARAGKRVVRLKGGDPLLFARGAEEALALAEAGVPFEIVPGIASPVAASAYAGISLTHRDLSSSVTFITGSDREGEEWSPEAWRKLATATGTICVLMGMRRIEAITQAIVDGGRDPSTPAAVVQWAARPNQKVVVATLGDIAERVRESGATNPAVIIVGDVVSLRQEMAWFDTRPLFGKGILIPRPAAQARETASAVRERAAEPLVAPSIAIGPAPDPEALRRAVREVGSYDWVVFTSANGVERFFAVVDELGLDARVFARTKIAVIGPRTGAAVRLRGLRPDLTAREYVAESLAQDLLSAAPEGRLGRVLLARAKVARDVLPERLHEAGADVTVVAAYETHPVVGDDAARLARLVDEEADVVLFTSSSMVSSLVDALGPAAITRLARLTVACIGPVTADTARALGVRVDVVAQRYTVDALLDALEAWFIAARDGTHADTQPQPPQRADGARDAAR
jgi:uroporphyrinogen III methyltransferase/synthase